MVPVAAAAAHGHPILSVLALSSRFDGLGMNQLMTTWSFSFQYSLCRVVLMVVPLWWLHFFGDSLSVLALSSRFDGLEPIFKDPYNARSFSTRSVESF